MKNKIKNTLKVLITSPTIDESEHIGGIATFTRLLIENNTGINYIHFARGKKKNQKKDAAWLIRQASVISGFVSNLNKTHGVEAVHVNMPLDKYAILRDTVFVILSCLSARKTILHFHGGKYSLNSHTPFILKQMVRLSTVLADRIITLGGAEAKFLREYYNVRPEKITALSNAVKIPEHFRQKPCQGALNILFLGRIEKTKGLEEIILAMKLLCENYDARLLIAGEGTEKETFLSECEKLIHGKYEYMGVVSGAEKQKLLDKSHVFIMPSYFEGLPYSLLEAMANCLVPIVTPVGAIPEIVEDGVNGFIVPVHEYLSIYRLIAELARNPRLMQKMALNARSTVSARFSLETHIKKINKIYFSLFSENRIKKPRNQNLVRYEKNIIRY